eukprot:GHVQ01009144.1.p1 GENE.GHVQ01009144.1~~GHVQ01009144.1.p1  ORF type:complete len:395 (+),score=62.68 GHVQ01009144.1:70-1254(+)
MAHVFERIVDNVVFAVGGRLGFYSGDTTKLLDDIRSLKPSVFVSVPRLYNRINDKVLSGVKEKGMISQLLFNHGLKVKCDRISSNGQTTNTIWDSLVFSKTRALLGGNVKWMLSGSAPLDTNVQQHVQALFCCPLLEGYGLTETMGGTFLRVHTDVSSGNVGGVFACAEFKLVNVEDMNYCVKDRACTEDNPQGLQRGEVWLRGPCVSPGYFCNPQETKATFDEDGWLHTGDICSILPNGGIKLIDRKKNLFKLSQGEYVAPEKIENVYLLAPLVSQVFVFGYSTESVLVAIVVPDAEAVQHWVSKQPNGETYPTNQFELCERADLKEAIMKEFREVGKASNLRGFEVVKDICLVAEPFSVDNHMLTPTFKLRRHAATKVFKKHIDDMYSNFSK